jgi:exopolysaccharide production protein ExoY
MPVGNRWKMSVADRLLESEGSGNADTLVRAGRESHFEASLVPQLDFAAAAPIVSKAGNIRARPLSGGLSLVPLLGFDLAPVWARVVGLGIDAARASAHSLRKLGYAWRARHDDIAHSVGGYPKRLLDITVALTVLILIFPLMLVVAVLIKLTTGGPVIFAHPRVGLNGTTFRCLKFRSMIVDGDEALERHLARNPAAAREWRESRKLKNDPRVTPFGRLLRKSSFDELPQLFNVLRGEMSCVGPRPIVAAELARYGSHVGSYLCTRPGITGMWQVNGRSMLSYRERVVLDRVYVRRWSIWLDVALLVRTIPAVLAFERAE